MGGSCNSVCSRDQSDLQDVADSRRTRAAQPIVIYGERYQSATRAILCLIGMAQMHKRIGGIAYEEINVFRNEHKTNRFFSINPNQTVPVLKHGDIVILSEKEIFDYLIKTSDRAYELFF